MHHDRETSIFLFFIFLPHVTIITREEEGANINMKKIPITSLFEQLFWKKIQHIHFLVHGHFSWSDLQAIYT